MRGSGTSEEGNGSYPFPVHVLRDESPQLGGHDLEDTEQVQQHKRIIEMTNYSIIIIRIIIYDVIDFISKRSKNK